MSWGEARASGAVGGSGAAGERRPRAVVTGASSGLGRELARGLAGRALVVPGRANRLVAGLAGILPRAWLVRLVHAFQRRRAPTLPSSISP